ncbi:MAG: sensor histidine kinase [Frankiaceae bacterium]
MPFPATVARLELSGDAVGNQPVVEGLTHHLARLGAHDVSPAGRAGRRVAEVCHDMRQPLATMRYLLENALQEHRSSLIGGYLSGINAQLDYMMDLTERLLGEFAVAREAVEVHALLQAVVATVQGEAAKSSARLSLVVSEQMIVWADEVSLRRAIINLAENAIRVAGAAGQVRISASRRPGMVAICVEDSGPGLEGAVNRRPALGLLITEQVARVHGGRVEAAVSSRLGGAAFWLLLPDPQT